MADVKLEEIVSLAKRRGFIYQGSEVYGGLSGTWDYGPLGVTLKRNIMNLWWKMFVDSRDDMYGVDAAILMNQKVWQASGHVDTFIDPLIMCLHCRARYRADKLISDKEGYSASSKEFFESANWHLKDFPEFSKDYTNDHAEKLGMIFGNGRVPAYDTRKELEDDINSNKILASKYLGIYPYIFLTGNGIGCEKCGSNEWSDSNEFNMMLRTFMGTSYHQLESEYYEGLSAEVVLKGQQDFSTKIVQPYTKDVDSVMFYSKNGVSYLRPETAQGIFTNYKNVLDSFYPDLPFGIAQQGKAFRNEISPRDFVFRSREFEQMEIEYFVRPEQWEEAFEMWRVQVHEWFKALGLDESKTHELEVPAEDLAHYSKRTIDFEFDFPHGRDELLGMAYRTDFDLMNIQKAAGKSMEYNVKGTNEKFVPHVIEPSFGVERALMAVLCSAYREDYVGGDPATGAGQEKRIYLALPEHLAPVKYCVSPLLKNKPELVARAREVYATLKKKYGAVMWDDNGNIGKRYRRQDEIGTPACIVIDFQTLEDGTVTVRDRDTTEQTRINIENL